MSCKGFYKDIKFFKECYAEINLLLYVFFFIPYGLFLPAPFLIIFIHNFINKINYYIILVFIILVVGHS